MNGTGSSEMGGSFAGMIDRLQRWCELHDLAQEEGKPLALSAGRIIELEDQGKLVDPFTGEVTDDPECTLAALLGEEQS